ncbi:MAG: hypothetical protein QOI47_1826 [Actinomycetota bacterium]|nr:hypothetical protein [Actinomycetota bacterium]
MLATDLDLDSVSARLERDGVAVVDGVLSEAEVADALARLWAAADESERRGMPTYISALDPNASNVRVFNLIELDPLFASLIAHPVADAVVGRFLGNGYIVSNFTANIARPGSGSMAVHSDQSVVMPEPWLAAHAVNAIWCLTDVTADNGATRYLPDSHLFQTRAELPEHPIEHMVPFEAAAGSVIVMEGRVWHTSGCNITEADDRALLFGYYTKPFICRQWNFTAAMSAESQRALPPIMRYRLGLDIAQNIPASL